MPNTPGTERRPILVVDDDADIRDALCDLLDSEGYAVLTASNGAEALKMLQRDAAPGLVLLDLMMPVMGGEELLRRCREAGITLPVIVVSAGVGESMPGASAVLQKPFSNVRLIELVRNLYAG